MIEHAWAMLSMEIRKRNPSTVEGLKQAARAAWESIDDEYLKALWNSLRDRAQAVLDADGGPTKYSTEMARYVVYWSQSGISIQGYHLGKRTAEKINQTAFDTALFWPQFELNFTLLNRHLRSILLNFDAVA